jgi:hypothetical protein
MVKPIALRLEDADVKHARPAAGGQVLELDHKHGCYVVDEGCDHLGAVWFNGDWERPRAEWPFFDVANAADYAERCGGGLAVEVEGPDDDRPICRALP